MPGKPNIDLQAPQPNTKDDVNYRHHEACITCANFNGRVGCSEVRGHVSVDGVCNLWTMKEERNESNKETIIRVYERETGKEFPKEE